MKISASDVVAIICCAISFTALMLTLKGSKRTDTKDIEERAIQNATVNVKLDSISTMLSDVKYDASATKKDVASLTERVATVESSAKSAHHRLDVLEQSRGSKNERNN